jgi:hypothetical protein
LSELFRQDLDVMLLTEADLKMTFGIKDLETNRKLWKNLDGSEAQPTEVELRAEDLQRANPGDSISKSKDVFLPDFALSKDEYNDAYSHIAFLAKKDGSVRLKVVPGFGDEDAGTTYPMAAISALPAELKSAAEQQLEGGLIIGLNGESLSTWLAKSVPLRLGADEIFRILSGKETGAAEADLPDWLVGLVSQLDEKIKEGSVEAGILRRVPNFQGYLTLATKEGDAVLLVSKERDKAAYVMKKTYTYPDGMTTDWDTAIYTLMKQFAEEYRRNVKRQQKRYSGEEPKAMKPEEFASVRTPKLRLKDNLLQTGNGFVLRRDFHVEDIMNIVDGGVKFDDATKLAEIATAAVESFSDELDAIIESLEF